MDFKIERDWKIFLLVGAFIIAILVASSPKTADKTMVNSFKAVCIALIGLYGGIRGRGEISLEETQPVASTADEEDAKNTFGIRPGVLRGLFGIILLVTGAVVGITMNLPDQGVFFVSIGLESLGIAVPGFVSPIR